MAKVFRAPIAPPPFQPGADYTQHMHAEEQYLEVLKKLAQVNNPQDLDLGSIVRFPYADGHAQYMFWSAKPLSLVWLELGDAWRADPALERGLNVTEVRAKIASEKRLTATFTAARSKKTSP